MGFRGITAGDWLRDIMRNEYGMQADSFHFSYDDKVYQPKEKPDNEKRVFFYAVKYQTISFLLDYLKTY